MSNSVWIASSPKSNYPALKKEISVDVAIVGGGICGLTAAILLKNCGKTVAVVDKSNIAAGETGYTTAHITEEIDTRYSQLISNFGEDGARKAAESSRAAIDRIERFVRDMKISCGFERVPAFLYAENENGVQDLIEELSALQKIGVDAEWIDDVPLPYRTKGAIKFHKQAQFHPREYLLAIAHAIDGSGSFIFENSKVTEIVEGEPCRVVCESGAISAQDVIVATYTPISNWLFIISKVPAYRTYALGARLKNDTPLGGLFWDTADPYHYIRSQRVRLEPEGDGEEILIVGGEDHKTGTIDNTQDCFDRLESFVRSRFDVLGIPFHWSGQIQESLDGLPYIGVNSFSKHEYVATGFTGNGMTFGTLGGIILSDLILGRNNPWADLYDATRIHALASAGEYIAENKDFPAYFIGDRFAKADTDSLSDVNPNEGKIVSIDGEKVAVYRDEHGELHGCSPVCTHMACHVHWNNAEKTWDCPCHGSRFDPDGRVANGPAVSDLKKVELPELQQVKK